ncbi:hypothetical protein CDAR_10021 [Caerostris darwini]|uniref:Uncharacterized protein n=1 Tax=Caerostris darwini TaxID=1538125 RepID=A0AAV4SEP4_9ARAC|nr:hypothetical protein CDAR_488471 [Caerostris darwini]GIY55044.1 hypothetical protein CDAR_10021 [Caerostris darwini]
MNSKFQCRPVNPTDGNGLNVGSFRKTRTHRLSLTNTQQCLLPKSHGVVRLSSVTKKGPVRRPSSNPEHRMRRRKGNIPGEIILSKMCNKIENVIIVKM